MRYVYIGVWTYLIYNGNLNGRSSSNISHDDYMVYVDWGTKGGMLLFLQLNENRTSRAGVTQETREERRERPPLPFALVLYSTCTLTSPPSFSMPLLGKVPWELDPPPEGLALNTNEYWIVRFTNETFAKYEYVILLPSSPFLFFPVFL